MPIAEAIGPGGKACTGARDDGTIILVVPPVNIKYK